MKKAAKKSAEEMKKEDFKELIEALNLIEKERDISKEVLLKAIEDSLLAACKDEYGKSENIRVHIDPETGEYNVFRDMKVVDEVVDPETEMTLLQAQTALPLRDIAVGDTVSLDVKTKNFGRIAAGKAKQVIVQKLREEERKVLFGQYCGKEKEVVTGIVQKFSKKNVIISLGKVDASLIETEQIPGSHERILSRFETEQIPGEVFRTGDRVKVYVVEVKDMTKGPRIVVSRTHPELVKRFFENEVSEVADGTVEIKALSREAGKRTKMAVWSNDPKVDPVGACVGVNGSRVNAVVDELNGEKIDIISWSDNPAQLIANALSPAEVISVDVIEAERLANVIVPDDQLTLAIGSKGQNARLAARLTGYKIDIKSESQAEGLA